MKPGTHRHTTERSSQYYIHAQDVKNARAIVDETLAALNALQGGLNRAHAIRQKGSADKQTSFSTPLILCGFGIESIAEPIPQEIEGKEGKAEEKRREEEELWSSLHAVSAFFDEGTPG